jgi:hypothetical protein
MLSPKASAARSTRERVERPRDFAQDDVVLGEFLGDQDLLVVDRRGYVLVATPLDSRSDWRRPAVSLSHFLDRFVLETGAKFWERPPN